VPLFAGSIKSRATRTCYVDALIVGSNQTVPWIIEIEESDIDPTHIFGKIGTSAAASHFIHRILDDVPVAIEAATFVQVVDTSRLHDRTSKIEQLRNFERIIRDQLRGVGIARYHLFLFKGSSDLDADVAKRAALRDSMATALRQNIGSTS